MNNIGYDIKIPTDISARDTLQDTMEFYNITQSELAAKLGVSQSYISAILNRKKFMSSEFALKIEKTTGLNAELLLKMDLHYQLNQLKAKGDLFEKLTPYQWVEVAS